MSYLCSAEEGQCPARKGSSWAGPRGTLVTKPDLGSQQLAELMECKGTPGMSKCRF